MDRTGEPRKDRSARRHAEQTAQSILAVLLLSTATGCATYDVNRTWPQATKSRSYARPPSVVIVRPGDTLMSISRTHGVSAEVMIDINAIDDPDRLRVGQRLVLPRALQSPRLQSRSTQVRFADVGPAEMPRSKEAPRRREAPRDLDAPAEGPDPRVAGARYYGFEGPRRKPAGTDDPILEDVADASPRVREIDPDGAFDEQPRASRQANDSNSRARFLWPVRGKVILGFGGRESGLHNDGINIAAEEGTQVKAADGGVVVYAGNQLACYGQLLLIKHPNGYVTAYAHNKELLVGRGDKVKRGQAIALVGDTGDVDQPQLHFEVRKGPRAVDPGPHLITATASR